MRLLAVILWFIVLPFNNVSALVIQLLPEANASGIYIELGEIAEIKADTEKEKENLKNIIIAHLPQKTTIYSRDQINQIISYHIRGQYILLGDKVIVKPIYTKILEEEILEKIKVSILKQYPLYAPENLKINFIEPIGALKIPYGKLEFKIVVPGGSFSQTKIALVGIWVDGSLYINKPVRMKIMCLIDVFVAKKKLQKDDLISEKDLIVSKRLVNNPNDYFTDIKDLKNYRVLYPVKRGKEILKTDLIKNIIVKDKDRVMGVFKDHDAEFEIPLVAMKEGGIGDLIFLKNPANNKTFKGKILEEKKVMIIN